MSKSLLRHISLRRLDLGALWQQMLLVLGNFSLSMTMELIFLFVLASTLSALFLVWFWSGRIQTLSLKEIFLGIWFYYALSVPIDLLLFPEGLRASEVGMPALKDPRWAPDILITFLHYLMCGAGFLFAYTVVWRRHVGEKWKLPKIEVPALWFVLAFDLLTFLLSVAVLGSFDRQEMYLVSREHVGYKIFSLVGTMAQALNLIYIHSVADRRKALWAVIAAFLFTLVSGGRTAIVFYVLTYIVRYEIRLTRRRLLAFGSLGLCFAMFWKTSWAFFRSMFVGGGGLDLGFRNVTLSLSRFEGIGPYEISAMLFHYYENSPLYFGGTYVLRTLQLLTPRFLSIERPQSLSEEFGQLFTPDFVQGGGGIGFSAMGEAWLNFSHVGPFLLGFAWGVAAKYFDKQPRTLLYWIFFIVTMRLFRSDFSSLIKNWVLMFGGCVLLWYLVLKLTSELLERRRQYQRNQSG